MYFYAAQTHYSCTVPWSGITFTAKNDFSSRWFCEQERAKYFSRSAIGEA